MKKNISKINIINQSFRQNKCKNKLIKINKFITIIK